MVLTLTSRAIDGSDIMTAITLWNLAQMYCNLAKNKNTEWGKYHNYYIGFCGLAYGFSIMRVLTIKLSF